MRIRQASANIARDIATKMVLPAAQRPMGNRASRFRWHIFKVTPAQGESAIMLYRLLAKLWKKSASRYY
jgi:hypothetical protein